MVLKVGHLKRIWKSLVSYPGMPVRESDRWDMTKKYRNRPNTWNKQTKSKYLIKFRNEYFHKFIRLLQLMNTYLELQDPGRDSVTSYILNILWPFDLRLSFICFIRSIPIPIRSLLPFIPHCFWFFFIFCNFATHLLLISVF